MFKVFIEAVFFNYGLKAFAIRVAIAVDIADNKKRLERIKRPACSRLGFGRLCSKKKHIMLLEVLIFFRNYAKIMLLSENYALCHRNYAT